MIVNGNSSLVSMKTRGNRATQSLSECGADRVTTGATLIALSGHVNDVLNPDPAVTTARQATERKHSVGAQSIDELASDAEDVGSLRGGDLVVSAKHHDACAVGDIVEHGAHSQFDRRVTVESFGQVLRI